MEDIPIIHAGSFSPDLFQTKQRDGAYVVVNLNLRLFPQIELSLRISLDPGFPDGIISY
ncbi:hypothetical protein D3C81_2141490 [compost metagenome]